MSREISSKDSPTVSLGWSSGLQGGSVLFVREKDGGPAEWSSPGTPTSQLGREPCLWGRWMGGWFSYQAPQTTARCPYGVTGPLWRGLAEKSGF